MKTYTFKLVVKEGNDEFWEAIKGKPACEEVKAAIQGALEDNGWFCGSTEDCQLNLIQFEDNGG